MTKVFLETHYTKISEVYAKRKRYGLFENNKHGQINAMLVVNMSNIMSDEADIIGMSDHTDLRAALHDLGII